ncbi:MAG: tetratricopeptide repeat protein [Isosphaeraceae bacterium]
MSLSRISFLVSLTLALAVMMVRPAPAGAVAPGREAVFQLYRAGRYAEALPALDALLERHPRDVEALVKRGNCLIRLGKPAKALDDFERVSRLSPMNPSAETDRGIALVMLGRHEEALQRFAQALRYWSIPLNASRGLRPGETNSIQAGKATTHCGIAQAYHRLGRDDEAVAEYGQAIAIFPNDPNAYIGRGDALAATGRNEQALMDYNEAVRIGPGSSRAFSRRGGLLADLGRDVEAMADQDRAIQLDPDFGHAYRLRAALLSRQGHNERALADLDRAVALQPDDAGSYKDRGGVLVRLGQHQRAIPDLDKAVSLDPNHARAYLNRGAAYSELGQYEKAIGDLDKAIALEPSNPAAFTNLGLACFMVNHYDRAVEALSEAVRLAPRNAVVHLNRGNVYARLGFRDLAAADYATVDKLDPRLMASLGGAGKLLDEMGRHGLAIRDQGRGLQADPLELELHLERANTMRSRSDWSGAVEEYTEALRLDPRHAEAIVARGWARLCAGSPGAEADARAYLDLKGWKERLSPYMALLGVVAARRAGNDLQAQTLLDEAIAQTPPGAWPSPLLRYMRHDIPTRALLEAATNPTQKAEVHTFAALELLDRGDTRAALQHLRWVRDQGNRRSIAADLARATLERLESPRQISRLPVDPGRN